MRLLYLTRTYTGHDARWLRVLAEQGLELGFLALQGAGASGFAAAHPGVEVLASPGLPAGATTGQLDGAMPEVRLSCGEWRPDVILAGPLTDAGYLATRILPRRTLLMSWAFDVLHEPATVPGARERLRQTLRTGRHLFVDCQALVQTCEEIAGRRFRQTCVLPWGLTEEDKPAPRSGWRRRLGDQSAKVILHTRGFEPVHQPRTVFESFRRAHAQDDTLRLWLAGAGAQRDSFETMVDAAGLRSAVRFLGRLDQPELAGAFAEADAYLACSLSDGSSLSLLQAMHAGLPCVVSDLPGNREWLEPGGGWLVPAAETETFARALTECVRLAPAARTETARTHRGRVKRRADLAANLPRLLQVLHFVAAGSRPAVAAPLSLAV